MGERRIRLIDVARATGVSRNMLAKLYYDKAIRIDLGDLARLCNYLQCSVGDFFEWVPDHPGQGTSFRKRARPKRQRRV
jgi:putative transcriptional regulator